jgi:hypothetical protein
MAKFDLYIHNNLQLSTINRIEPDILKLNLYIPEPTFIFSPCLVGWKTVDHRLLVQTIVDCLYDL